MKHKILFWAGSLAAFLFIVAIAHYKIGMNPKYKILSKTTDLRGYTSVVFTDGLDTGAYDYLTEQEYKLFVETGDPYSSADTSILKP